MQSQVRVLRESVARKIAAGEVIDRPNSIVRELMDNAIDAGSTRLDLSLEGGGIDRIRLVDNGRGMSGEDLKLCCLPHATSKITTEDDLMTIRSLGFRGEALSSIAASSRLEIITSRDDESWKLSVLDGRITDPLPWRGDKGTIVDAQDLFYSIPARRKFLKRPASEGTLCRKTFLEKALPFPDIHFQLTVNGKIRTVLPPSSLKDRVCSAFGDACPAGMMEERKTTMDGAEITIIAGRPEWNRSDRRFLQVYANNRRIDEYAFIQAMQYGYDELLPGGVFPVCFTFLQVDPALVDFNIHPAKREARFRNQGAIHHELVSLIKDFLREFRPVFPGSSLPEARQQDLEAEGPGTSPLNSVAREKMNWNRYTAGHSGSGQGSYSGSSGSRKSGHHSYPATPEAQTQRFTRLVRETPPLRSELHPRQSGGAGEVSETAPESIAPENLQDGNIRYMGQIMGVFLLAELGDSLFIVDQHAAHEKILFEKYKNEQPPRQDLLIPYEFEASEEEVRFMEAHRELFEKLGISFSRGRDGLWEITSLPRAALSMEKEIAEFLKCRKGSPSELQKELYATMSCRNAIKEGDPIDPGAAMDLLKGSLALENPRCPHGRLLWFRLSRNELYGLVGRLV